MIEYNCFKTIYAGEVKRMFIKRLEEFLEHVAVKHATSASCFIYYEPKVPKTLMQIIKKESK